MTPIYQFKGIDCFLFAIMINYFIHLNNVKFFGFIEEGIRYGSKGLSGFPYCGYWIEK